MAFEMFSVCLFACLYTALQAEFNMFRAHKPASQMEGRIVNGEAVPINQYPFFALILRKERYGTSVHCGGTIISKRVILTAARCLTTDNYNTHPLDSLKVKLGASTFKDGTRYDVCKLDFHQKFPFNDLRHYDVGLIMLTRDIKFSSTVKKAKLATDGWTTNAHKLTVMGFGHTTKLQGTYSDKLQITEMTYMSREQCDKNAHKTNSGKVPNHMFCMVGSKSNGVCYGDIGSPIISRGMVVGVVHEGRVADCGSGTPSMHTDVASLRSWIDDTKAILERHVSICRMIEDDIYPRIYLTVYGKA